MFPKFRHGLGYESLCREVADWPPLAAVLPDPAGWFGAASDDVDEADDPLRHRRDRGFEPGFVGQGGPGEGAAHRLRADTMVIPENAAYPTDSGLLAKAVSPSATLSRRSDRDRHRGGLRDC